MFNGILLGDNTPLFYNYSTHRKATFWPLHIHVLLNPPLRGQAKPWRRHTRPVSQDGLPASLRKGNPEMPAVRVPILLVMMAAPTAPARAGDPWAGVCPHRVPHEAIPPKLCQRQALQGSKGQRRAPQDHRPLPPSRLRSGAPSSFPIDPFLLREPHGHSPCDLGHHKQAERSSQLSL